MIRIPFLPIPKPGWYRFRGGAINVTASGSRYYYREHRGCMFPIGFSEALCDWFLDAPTTRDVVIRADFVYRGQLGVTGLSPGLWAVTIYRGGLRLPLSDFAHGGGHSIKRIRWANSAGIVWEAEGFRESVAITQVAACRWSVVLWQDGRPLERVVLATLRGARQYARLQLGARWEKGEITINGEPLCPKTGKILTAPPKPPKKRKTPSRLPGGPKASTPTG